jgi:hypothetical protein
VPHNVAKRGPREKIKELAGRYDEDPKDGRGTLWNNEKRNNGILTSLYN